MRNPSFIQYIKDPESMSSLDREIKTGYARNLPHLNKMIDECILLGYKITKVNITDNPKNY